ncbi:19808_t:CDS:2 [Entrophospora sp. SA101]|nr:14674_t:CDS:2 [Entrophospora sp. SA101]CAJ0747282.1 19808_t:CDS:2 [Entrophospora sp. SA101]CAJ0832378.1 10190_t:CDS:2 [Entrophospora sp. SA101]CAJ0890654.1 2744_t:CDS:2 [Entrophospora sp. SA101]
MVGGIATQINQQLYKKLDAIKELEALERMPEHFLKAYLIFKQAAYSNYQDNFLEQAQFNNPEQLIKKYSEEIGLVEQEEQKPEQQPTNKQLLIMLGERIAAGEIKRD